MAVSAGDARRAAPAAYADCAAASAAGRSHIRRGEPDYRRELDGDRDGLACE
jgi:hypothetical protein